MNDDSYSYDCRIGEKIGETDDGQPVVAQTNDGSVNDAFKDASPTPDRYDEPEERGTSTQGRRRRPSETTFKPDYGDHYGNPLPKKGADGRDLEEQWNRMWEWQHGHRDGRGAKLQREKLAITEALANTLRLSDRLTGRAKRLAIQTDGRAFTRIGSMFAIALGAIAVAQNETIERAEDYEDRIQVRKYDHHDGDAPLFKALAENHDVQWSQAIQKVKEQIGGR